jgi:hypothetical protein
MQTSPVFARLLAQLKQHGEVSQRLGALDNFSAHFAPLKQSLSQIPENKGAHFRHTADRFAATLERFMFVSLVCRRKIDAINDLVRYSTESQNAIALAQGARSLVEHVAVQAEIARAVTQFGERIKGQTEGPKIHDAISKAEEFLLRCYSGRSPKVEPSKSGQALHINDCIDTLEAERSGFSDAYDFLCEFVHPNHGSNSLVSSVELNVQVNSIVIDMSRPEVQRMGEIVLNALETSEEIENRGHASVALLGFYASRFMQENSKISNIFAARKIKPIGDGKTKETAFFFPGTRDAKESFELWAKYLENRKIGVNGRQLAAMEGNSAYDLYETTQGKLWHRIEYPEIEDGDAGEEQV